MDRKGALLEVIDKARRNGDELASRLSASSRAASGTYERWAAKDVFAHCAEWLARDVSRLKSADDPLPVYGEDGLDDENREIFDRFSGKSWDEVFDFFNETLAEARSVAESMSTAELDRERQFADGTARSAWRLLAGHALMHPAAHLSLVYRREGMREHATELEETTAEVLAKVDDSAEWIGTMRYNLACHYALIHEREKAISLLREALAKNPGLIEWSRKDSDLDGIRDDPEFKNIYPA